MNEIISMSILVDLTIINFNPPSPYHITRIARAIDQKHSEGASRACSVNQFPDFLKVVKYLRIVSWIYASKEL